MTAPKLQPALLGGAVLGVLSALPIVNIANCCCIWFITGGVIAAWVMQQNHPEPIAPGDGAVAGLLAGVVGAVIWAVLYIPVHTVGGALQQRAFERLAERSSDLPPVLRDALQQARRPGAIVVSLLIGFAFTLVVGSLLAMLGGMLGAMMFRKERAPAVPPPPSI